MGIIYKIDKRRTVPRWRSYEKTSALGELSVIKPVKEKPKLYVDDEILRTEKQYWHNNNNLISGGNLLSAAFVLDRQDDFKDVAKFILDNEPNIKSPLRKLAGKIVNEGNQTCVDTDIHLKEINNLPRFLSNDINRLRTYLKREPKNAIAWIELGRLYSIVGKTDKSLKAILTALQLNKDNRFIVRSASRYFSHFQKDHERALHTIKKSDYAKSDPWLISADIAYSSMLNRNSRLIKIGSEYLDNDIHDFFSVTELASSLGTMETMNGKDKKAKQYFRQSLIDPNDNSLAQISWMIHESEVIQRKLNQSNIECAFEVKAQLAYDRGNFQEAFNHAYSWIKDEPFSTRPIRLASYLSGVFLNKLNIAILVLKFGLSINPGDRDLINDLMYFLVQNDETKEAIEIYKQVKNMFLANTGEEIKLVFSATAGLIEYKLGNFKRGEELYLSALKQAQENKDYYLLAIGLANYIEQEIEISSDLNKIQGLVLRLLEVTKNQSAPDLLHFKNRALNKFEKYKTEIKRLV